MSAYIKHLNDALVVERAAREEIELTAGADARDRLIPLVERLERLLKTIPVEIQAEGLSLSVLQTSLRGRWRGTCHPGELGTALRKLGYKRRRQWVEDDGFKALWYP